MSKWRLPLGSGVGGISKLCPEGHNSKKSSASPLFVRNHCARYEKRASDLAFVVADGRTQSVEETFAVTADDGEEENLSQVNSTQLNSKVMLNSSTFLCLAVM